MADAHPEIVQRIAASMDQAVTHDARYEVGTTYKGGAIWKREQ